MDRLTEMELLVRIADQQSLSRAAESLKLANSAASRILASLEQRLGAQLVLRSTRRLSLTETGARYVESCRAVLADVQAAEAAVNASTLVPSGTLRVTAALPFCVNHIAPLLRPYTTRYPGVRVQIVAANRYIDLIHDNIDIAIRAREAEIDSGITIRQLARTRRILAASPGYLARRGTPLEVGDLSGHDLLIYSHSHRPDELVFARGGDKRELKVIPLLEADDGEVLRAAALDGLGITVQPRYVLHDDIIAGRLVPVLDDWDLPRLQMNIAFQSRRHMSAKVRTFIDFLVEHFDRMGYDHKWTTFDNAPPVLQAVSGGAPSNAR